MTNKDTICAIATAAGSGAIAIIRLSGEKAFEVTKQIFQPVGDKNLSLQKPNTIHFGTILSGSEIIDEVLVSIYKSPHSYTGEDAVEISCHGSIYIQQTILQLLVENGARLATAGEFTMRAFLNGKLDLAQAEAVADLISSSSEGEHKLAIQQMRGGFSEELQKLRAQLLHISSLMELELDFAEEDVEFADRDKLRNLIYEIQGTISPLLESFKLGNAIKNGIPVAIIGEPNVGKSTLLNTLLNEERAIVSDIPGTTRDSIEDSISIEGTLFRFIDTAGIRQTDDSIENLGIERTYQVIDKAEIVILITEPEAGGIKLMLTIAEILKKQKKLIVVFNKIDVQEAGFMQAFENDYKTVYLSAKKQQNIEELLETLVELSGQNKFSNNVIISNIRHYEALNHANKALKRALNELSLVPTDLLSVHIRETLHYLGEITGEINTDEILGNIFKNFCIGK